jgi:hypothetical protein
LRSKISHVQPLRLNLWVHRMVPRVLATQNPSTQTTPPSLVWASSLRCRTFSHGSLRLDLKPAIWRPPWAFPRGGGEKHKIEVVASRRRKIGGGTATGIASGHLSSFTNISSLLYTIRGAYFTAWTMTLWW